MGSIPRILAAAVVGYLAAWALSIAGSAVAMAVFGRAADGAPTPGYLALNVVLGILAAMVGGYLCAHLAPSGSVTITVSILVLTFVILGALAARTTNAVPRLSWYPAIVTMLGTTGLLIGAVVRQSRGVRPRC